MRTVPGWLVLCAVLALPGGCSSQRSGAGARPPMLLLAVDGLDWELLLPAMRAGRVPHLTGLARRGSAARLTTFEPTDSPVIWTSVATGKVKEKHGIRVFAQRLGGRLVPVTSNQRLARPFWDILAEAGYAPAIVGWWVTWPATPLKGWMVAPVSTVAGRTWKGSIYPDLPDQTWPPELLAELQPKIREVESEAPDNLQRLFPEPEDAPPWVTEFRRDLGWSLTTDRLFVAAAESLARQKQPRFLGVYQGAVDVAGHRFWGYSHRPAGSPPPNGVTASVDAALSTYMTLALEEVDAALGRLLSALPPESDILVISDHGMHGRRLSGPGEPGRNPLLEFNTGAHGDAPDGVLIAAGPSFRAAKPPFGPPDSPLDLPRLGSASHAAVLDIAPTLLHLHGLPVGEDMDGRVLVEILVDGVAVDQVRRVATHELGPPPATPPLPISTPADDDVIERLRSLGYIGQD